MKKPRIWELDALRGLCILGMVVFHLIYDLTELSGLLTWQLPPLLSAVATVGGYGFVVLSGLCVTLGSRPVRRGLMVFGCGMLCFAVTWALSRLGLLSDATVIRFGVLHCLGLCMLLWPPAAKLPTWLLALLGAATVVLGRLFAGSTVSCPWLFPLGLTAPGFTSGDYFPLAPCLGWFLLGAVLGRTLYRKKESLLPAVDGSRGIPGFLCLCGRHSLTVYLLHQPLLTGLTLLLTTIIPGGTP